MAARRIDEAVGAAAVAAVVRDGDAAARPDWATAVRYSLQRLAAEHPGASVEVRVPPFGAVQALPGPGHTRGTPPNVVELDAATWIALATGSLTWDDAVADHRVRASGTRAELSAVLPVPGV